MVIMYNGLRRVVLWNVSTGPENRVVQIWHQGLHLCEKGQVPSTYLSCYSFEFTEAHKIGFYYCYSSNDEGSHEQQIPSLQD